MASHWGQSVTDGAAGGDFDGDGLVGPKDAAILGAHSDLTSSASAGVPEPTTLVLLLGGLAVWLLSRWTR